MVSQKVPLAKKDRIHIYRRGQKMREFEVSQFIEAERGQFVILVKPVGVTCPTCFYGLYFDSVSGMWSCDNCELGWTKDEVESWTKT